MRKLFNVIDKKAGSMSQEKFNLYVYILLGLFLIVPMFAIGFHNWSELYLK